MRSGRPSYTLFELLLVLAVLVILAALAYPSLSKARGGYALREAVDQVRTAWAEARTHAVNEGQPYRFAVVPGQGNFRIAPDAAAYWSGGDLPPVNDPSNRPLVHEGALPRGIRFNLDGTGAPPGGDTSQSPDKVDPSSYTTVVTFLPDGTAQTPAGGVDNEDVVVITLRVAGVRPMQLKLRTLTGAVTVRPVEEGRP
ncbi:MAG TPA: hypothetical protein VFA26_09135 [Gemmataceae bacterium]|nr:hypothetical protein [Gemmataceae bacterium]